MNANKPINKLMRDQRSCNLVMGNLGILRHPEGGELSSAVWSDILRIEVDEDDVVSLRNALNTFIRTLLNQTLEQGQRPNVYCAGFEAFLDFLLQEHFQLARFAISDPATCRFLGLNIHDFHDPNNPSVAIERGLTGLYAEILRQRPDDYVYIRYFFDNFLMNKILLNMLVEVRSGKLDACKELKQALKGRVVASTNNVFRMLHAKPEPGTEVSEQRWKTFINMNRDFIGTLHHDLGIDDPEDIHGILLGLVGVETEADPDLVEDALEFIKRTTYTPLPVTEQQVMAAMGEDPFAESVPDVISTLVTVERPSGLDALFAPSAPKQPAKMSREDSERFLKDNIEAIANMMTTRDVEDVIEDQRLDISPYIVNLMVSDWQRRSAEPVQTGLTEQLEPKPPEISEEAIQLFIEGGDSLADFWKVMGSSIAGSMEDFRRAVEEYRASLPEEDEVEVFQVELRVPKSKMKYVIRAGGRKVGSDTYEFDDRLTAEQFEQEYGKRRNPGFFSWY